MSPYPHEGGCAQCRALGVCNACGAPLDSGHCTNGRCSACHRTVCVTRGLDHGYGIRGVPHEGEARPAKRASPDKPAAYVILFGTAGERVDVMLDEERALRTVADLNAQTRSCPYRIEPLYTRAALAALESKPTKGTA